MRSPDIARLLLALDGLGVALAGVVALFGATHTLQGEGLLLLVAGIALLVFGVMIVFRWVFGPSKPAWSG